MDLTPQAPSSGFGVFAAAHAFEIWNTSRSRPLALTSPPPLRVSRPNYCTPSQQRPFERRHLRISVFICANIHLHEILKLPLYRLWFSRVAESAARVELHVDVGVELWLVCLFSVSGLIPALPIPDSYPSDNNSWTPVPD